MKLELAGGLPNEKDVEALRPHLMAATRQSSEWNKPLLLDSASWRAHAEAHAHTSVSGKLHKVLEVFRKRSAHVADAVIFRHKDAYPLILTLYQQKNALTF